jgi:UDP-N-acetylglucosamine 2-epimerase (non-hydrolysing)
MLSGIPVTIDQPLRVTVVAGARPNFMKVAPIIQATRQSPGIATLLVHTGQHYDEHMSAQFFRDLQMPEPDCHLEVGSANHAVQTARIMMAFDKVIEDNPTDAVIVVGDVNSTLACALVAVKRGIPIAHVEAGLRSHDRSMPEEINRVLTDSISDYLFTTEPDAADNLRHEGIPDDRIFFVGNVMIDTLIKHRALARERTTLLCRLGLQPRQYAACTLHRPSNVDMPEAADRTVRALFELAKRLPVVLPLHPRSRRQLEAFGLLEAVRQKVAIIEPLGYLDFLALIDHARLVFTDSGGIQEETTVLGVPCLTFRENTERPITVTQGTNRVVGLNPERVGLAADEIMAAGDAPPRIPELWDGHAAERIIAILRSTLSV